MMNQNHQQSSDSSYQNPFADHSPDYAPYPKLNPNDVAPPPDPLSSSSHPPPTANRSSAEGAAHFEATTMPAESNPYVSPPARGSTSNNNNAIGSVKDVLEKWGKKAADATTKAGDIAGNMWQHLKTSPNMTDAAVARISRETKVLAEGGYEKVFRQTFEISPEEQLKKSYACYLSTSAGPVMGTLYLSTVKLAFCSDNPLSYQTGDEKTEWSYYKMIIPLYQVKAANSSTSKINHGEKYIQIISVDGHEFWFMGFVNYESAVKNLQLLSQPQQ